MHIFYLETKRAESTLWLGVQCSPPEVRMDGSGTACLPVEAADTPSLVDEHDRSRHREMESILQPDRGSKGWTRPAGL